MTPRRGFTIIEGWIGAVFSGLRREHSKRSRWALNLGIFEIILVLVVALIVIPPENLPDVMRATGKILRELRLASNMVVRELGGALDQAPEHHEPVVNTMRPSSVASGANIAQSTAPADLKESSDADARPIA
ncbi:MAG: twin-arginine translocase TatA/TatE family subunit, partial [Deltaproteobacteria bacterium]|nr:twin-arginine translocase TatA/TatE family subunit [Deltaproteobacteria bacterium]